MVMAVLDVHCSDTHTSCSDIKMEYVITWSISLDSANMRLDTARMVNIPLG